MDEIITQKSDNKNIAMTHVSNYTVHAVSTNENTQHTLRIKDTLAASPRRCFATVALNI